MIDKRLLRPERVRRVPRQFSWIDPRLVRDGHVRRCDARALALYLLLVSVGDHQGLSYYSDRTAAALLSLPEPVLAPARQQLLQADLIAYERPLYQVLSLDPSRPSARTERRCSPAAASIAQILRAMAGGAA